MAWNEQQEFLDSWQNINMCMNKTCKQTHAFSYVNNNAQVELFDTLAEDRILMFALQLVNVENK